MSLHERLRAATAQAHRTLEQELGWQARVATRAGYRDLLARFHGFHDANEPPIGRGLGDEAFFAPRRRLARLADDLAHLGLSPEAIAALPRPDALAIRGRADALGALYVLEGSSLGGQLILRHLTPLHDVRAGAGGSYFAAHGRAAGAMWAAFRDELETLSGSRKAQEAAEHAALATFEAMRAWLVRSLGPIPAA